MQVVWFKRDLRVHDHRALCAAADHGPVLPLYIIEPEAWTQPDISGRQFAFVAESLADLSEGLERLGTSLVIRVGRATEVFSDLRDQGMLSALWSHEETGNAWSFERDKQVALWCREQGIRWRELQNHGVLRGPSHRDGWAADWERFMGQPISEPRALERHAATSDPFPDAQRIGIAADPCPERQSGGRRAAQQCLATFLENRSADYQRAMSSPLTGGSACSRLSPHLAWGTLSVREVMKATQQRQVTIASDPAKTARKQARSLRSFSARLHWHCHFIQKLEDEPRMEFENLHPAYDGVRPRTPDAERLNAWRNGETGLPFVDACMRSLRATGWLNFRMRAMVMATASYHLWLDWRAPGEALARLFTDYEPGIHWPQVQMQSGTTGINTIRIYNPVKQGYDQDPKGLFTRKWVPELDAIEDEFLHEPWKANNAGQVLGRKYPEPIVDHLAAARFARETLWSVRRQTGFRKDAAAIHEKHGSRKRSAKRRGRRVGDQASAQLELPL